MESFRQAIRQTKADVDFFDVIRRWFHGASGQHGLNARSFRREGPHADFHLHARTQSVQDRHEAIDSEPPEVRITDPGEVRGRNAGAAMGGAYGQAFAVKSLDDFSGEYGLELLSIDVLMPKIAEHIAAPARQIEFFAFHTKHSNGHAR